MLTLQKIYSYLSITKLFIIAICFLILSLTLKLISQVSQNQFAYSGLNKTASPSYNPYLDLIIKDTTSQSSLKSTEYGEFVDLVPSAKEVSVYDIYQWSDSASKICVVVGLLFLMFFVLKLIHLRFELQFIKRIINCLLISVGVFLICLSFLYFVEALSFAIGFFIIFLTVWNYIENYQKQRK